MKGSIKMNDIIMELNKETALRLWTQQFGSKQKAFDFSGREIARAAYNNRGSKFGWNVDHILPQSRGGKTVDHNLICCHMLTNDEKADKFPCFKANGKRFEIQKRQNHYELIELDGNSQTEGINFLDAAQGLDFWNNCDCSDKATFIGYVKIDISMNSTNSNFLVRFENFLKELFNTNLVFLTPSNIVGNKLFTVLDYEVSLKEQIENLLDTCVILNTYASYFVERKECRKIKILCGVKSYSSDFDMMQQVGKEIIANGYFPSLIYSDEKMIINELVKINTRADEKLKNVYPISEPFFSASDRYYPYDYIFPTLQEDLNKQN